MKPKELKTRRNNTQYNPDKESRYRLVKCLKCDAKVNLKFPYFMCDKCRLSVDSSNLEDHSYFIN